MGMPSRLLAYGMYFGTNEIRREVPGFSVSVLSPEFRAEDVPLHSHQSASFVLVLEGRYLSNAAGAARRSASSTLIFNPAGTTHRDSFELARGRFVAVSVSDQSRRIAADGANLPTDAIAFSTGAAVKTAFRVAAQCLRRDSESAAIMEDLCWELLSDIAGEPLWRNREYPRWLNSVRNLLRDECNRQVRITEIAWQLGVHPVHLARTFRRAFRCTPSEYLARCRVELAMTLLRKPNLSLAEISLAAGFFDQSHFSRNFRQHFGIPPQSYRRRIRPAAQP